MWGSIDGPAVEAADALQLMTWVRTLPSPNDQQRPLMVRMLARLEEIHDQDPAAYVSASKLQMRGPGG